MKSKSIFEVVAVMAVGLLSTIAVLRQPQLARAQDEVGPPIHLRKDRNITSSGMVGITHGQTIRLNVVNTGDAICPCQRVILNFRNADGQLLRRGDGSIIQQEIELEPGRATSLDLNYDELPPSPIRLQLRATVDVQPPPTNDRGETPPPVHDRFVTTVEVFDNATGRTQVFTDPAIAH